LSDTIRALYLEPTIDSGAAGEIVSGHAMFEPRPGHQGAPGWVQGGLSATVLDFVCARLAKVALGSSIATATFDLRYRQPVLVDGGPYRVEGSTALPKSRTVRVEAAILSPVGHPLVEASGLFVAVIRDPVTGAAVTRDA